MNLRLRILRRKCYPKTAFLVIVLLVVYFSVTHFRYTEICKKVFQKIFGKCEIFTWGCIIKYYDIYVLHSSESYQKEFINCDYSNKPRLVKLKGSQLYISKKAAELYSFEDQLVCYYRGINTSSDNEEDYKKVSFVVKKVYFYHKIQIHGPFDFMEVACSTNGTEVYKDFFVRLHHSRRLMPTEPTPRDPRPKYNVLVLGIDTISRLSFMRNFPVTMTFIEDVFDVVEFSGYHKMAMDTSGHEHLLNLIYGRDLDPDFPDFPIWDIFKRKGYYTAYGEDIALMGPFVNGKQVSTDHVWTNINLKFVKKCGYPAHNPRCIGNEPAYMYLFDYVQQFVKVYHDTNFFGFFWSYSLAYSFTNYAGLVLDDVDLTKLLTSLDSYGIFDNTFLFLVSGQGRYFETNGTIHERQAWMEESLPLLWAILPDNFSQNHPHLRKNLEINSKRLVTVSDLYNTIKSIGLGDFESDKYVQGQEPSLFYPVSSFRRCASLGIPKEICACI